MRRSLLRRVFRRKILLLVSLSLVLLLALLLVVVHTPWVRAFALKKAAAYVERQYGIKLVADSLQYDLATLRFWLTNVSLTVRKSNLPAFFQSDEVRVRLPVSFLFKKGFHLKELSVERPRVRIIYSDRGIPNTPSLPASTTPISFILEKVSIREGLFVFSDPASHIDIKMPGIGIDVFWLERSVHALRLAAKDEGLAEIGRTRIPIQGLLLAGIFDPDQASIKELSVSVDHNRLQIKGEVKDFLSPRFQLEAQGDFVAPDIQGILNLQEHLEGRLELRANLSGGFKIFTAEGKLAGRNLGFGSWRKADLAVTFRWDGRSFSVPSFKVESPFGNLFGKAGSSPQDGGRENSVEVSWDSLDLRRVSEDLKLPLKIASRSEGNLQARWIGSFFPTLRAKADIKLSSFPGSPSGAVYPSLSGWIKADLEPESSSSAAYSSLLLIRGQLARSGKSEIGIDGKAALGQEFLDLSALRLSLPGGVIDASARYPLRNKNGPFEFSIRAEKIDLERTAELLGFPQDLLGTLTLEAKGSGVVNQPEIEFHASGENLRYGKNELGRANLEGKAAAGQVGFRFSSDTFPISSLGVIMLRPPYDMKGTFSFSNLAIGSLLKLAYPGNKRQVNGSLTGTVDYRASLNKPADSFRADVSVEKISFGPPELLMTNQGPIKISFDGKSLDVKEMTLAGPGTRIQIQGDVPAHPSSGRRLLSLQAGIDLALLNMLGGDIDARGRAEISAKITGSLSAPEVELGGEIKEGSLLLKPMGLPLEGIGLSFAVRGNQAEVDKAVFRWGKAAGTLAAKFPLHAFLPSVPSGTGPDLIRLHGEIRNFDLGDMGSALHLGFLQGMSGKVDLDLDLQGRSPRWTDLAGELDINTLRISAGGMSFGQEEKSRILVKEGRFDLQGLKLSGAGISLDLSGSVNLPLRTFSGVTLRGRLDSALLRSFLTAAEISGQVDLQIQVSGDLGNPQLDGTLDAKNIAMRWPEYRLYLRGIEGRVDLQKSRIVIQNIHGTLNQGNFSIRGAIDRDHFLVSGADVQISADNVMTNYPQGLLGELSLDLRLGSDGRRQRLSGKVTLIQGQYAEDFYLGSQLSGIFARSYTPVYTERSPLLDHLDFNIDLTTANPVQIRNNVADAQVQARLKLTGTLYNPGLGGRLIVVEGGRVTFAGNSYQIEQGGVDFVNPNRIVPDLNVKAVTRVSGYTIQLSLSGTPGHLSASLTSDPVLPESSIISLLMTGVPLRDIKSPVLNVLGDQTLTYLGGALTGQLGKTVARGLGLETLRIDTGLVSPQQSPEARITIGQHLARDLQLIFSQGLRDSNNRIIILNFEPLRNFNFQALHQQSDVYRFSFQNELHFGPSTLGSLPLEYLIAQKPLEIGRVELSGDLGFPEQSVRKRLSLKEGKRFDFFSYRNDVQKLRDLYRKSGHLQAAISAAKETEGGRINLSFRIQAGPRVEIHSQGLRIPRSLREILERAWMQNSDDRIRLDDVQRKTEAYLCSKRYFRAEVAARVESESQTARRVLITVNAGNRFSRPALIFSGNKSLAKSRLTKALDPKTICSDIFTAPQNSSRTLRDFYRQSGYLQARVERPVKNYGRDGNSVSVTFKIEEGPLFSIRSIAFEGNRSIDSSALLKASGLRTGEIFLPEKFDRSQSNLRSVYEAKGFNRVDIEAGIRLDQANSGLAVDYKITENSRAAISDIQISGNRMTGSGFIRNVLSFRKGDLVTFRGLNESRRDLYDLGVFQMVNIDAVPSGGSASQADPARDKGNPPLPYVAKIDVAESKPVTFRYGLQYDTETRLGGNAELVHHNLFRRAVALGGSTNLDRLEQAGRAFIQTQHFLGKADTQFFVYLDRRVEPAFDVDVRGLTLQQQRKLGERSILSYDYSFERNRSLAPSGPLNQAFNIGRLTLALTNDSRDDVFDPRKGHFISQTLEYGARFLGSEVRYLRYFGQSFFYFRLTPFLLYATGLRLGLGQGLGRDLLPGQRFFAGGSNTIRGFDFHEIGPKDPATGEAVGGNALFVLNEELRFPIYDVVSGAAFLDLGQVYPSVSRFNPFRVRSAAGFGLRLSLGALLGRFDLGFKLNRRTGESPYRVYFSIGQAF